MKFRPWHLALITVVVVAVMTLIVAGGTQPGSVKTEGEVMTKVVSGISPDATATFAIRLQEGNDVEHESAHIFEVLEGYQSIATLSLDTQDLTVTVAYDSALVSEADIRQKFAEAGYLERSIEDAVPAELAADGSGQTIHLVPGDALEPSFIRAAAGVPLTITFSAGTGHLASVAIPALEITQDLTAGDAAITIANPVPGEYELVCAEGYTDATLVIE